MNKLLLSILSKILLSGTNNNILPEPIGDSIDSHNCLISGGYTYCESTRNCIRQWVTPCPDNYDNCDDCITKQRTGMNIACPEECNMIAIDPIYPPPLPPTPIPIEFHSKCPNTMCMMYCDKGFKLDNNGCNICECEDEIIVEQPECNNQYVCPKVTELFTDKDNYITYQLSLLINPDLNIKNVYAIYGDPDNSMYIPPAYQVNSIFDTNIGGSSDYLISLVPEQKYDSWLTISLTDGDPNNLLSTVGIDFSKWTENQGILVDNGAIFYLNPQIVYIQNECIIAHITIRNNNFEEMIINVQGKFNTDDERYWTQEKIIFKIKSHTSTKDISDNCISWFDGCKTCDVNNGILGSCTNRICLQEEEPYCIINTDMLNFLHSGH